MEKRKSNLSYEHSFFSFITATLNGISQVILIENPLTGVLILLAITISDYFLGMISLVSAIIGTLIGTIGGADKKIVNQGLFGYNSVLTGIALTEYLNGPYQWIIALIASAIAALFTAALMHIMRKTEIPILTFPYFVLTWFILLASYRLETFHLSADLEPQSLANWTLNIAGKGNWIEGSFKGIGQIFFLDNTLSGVLLFIAIFFAGWKFGLYAIIGNITALLVSYQLEGEHGLIFMGLYGYNAILAILAVSIVFNTERTKFSFITGIIAACLTVPIMAGLSTLLLPYGLPALTMPFVLSTWLLLGAKKVLPKI
ncbi:urea transporter [Peribacillus huizhouensis]|uniref:Urea transporter n=1 Tax=Peribacillus huizhouensis TaxID=1501239 RepID=A0ABR6CUM7_9BACI|nr:urea transporter [Peribacillus huizhouensis]MBA9028724.1 urea transporter [Peribacillus huizhouensis]